MFIVTLTYVADLARIDEALDDHRAWLDEQYEEGVFLASGAQVPRTGGVILAAGIDRAELDRRLADDPFGQRGLAEYAVTEFTVTRAAGALRHLLED